MNFEVLNLMAEMSAFYTKSVKISDIIKTIENYFDSIYDDSTKSRDYINFKEAIVDIEEAINSAEAKRLQNYREACESMK